MMSEGIDHSAQTPTIVVSHEPTYRCSGSDGSLESRIRIVHDHHYAHGTATQRLGAKMRVLRRFVREPKFRFSYGQPSDHRATLVVESEQFPCPKRCLVELNRLCPVPD